LTELGCCAVRPDDHDLSVAQLLGELLELSDVAVLVLSSVQKEHRLVAGA